MEDMYRQFLGVLLVLGFWCRPLSAEAARHRAIHGLRDWQAGRIMKV